MNSDLTVLPLGDAPFTALVALFAPVTAALLLAALPWVRKRGMPAAWICIAATLAATVSAVQLLLTQLSGAQATAWMAHWLVVDGRGFGEIGLRLDGISAPMLVVVCVVALCVQVFSVGYMHDEPPASFGRYFAYHALFLFSMNLLVVGPDLLQVFAGWELVGVTSYLLIGYYYQKPSAARAALKAFWITKLADMGIVVALAMLFALTHSFSWAPTSLSGYADVIAALLFFGVVGKSAQFPLHVWLPDAMEGPTPVSALLHAATMVAAGVFLVVRADPLFAAAIHTRDVMLVLGAGTALYAACLALVQTDIKKVLAYSTCSQLGYMIAALGAGSTLGGFFHLTTHAFFKALLFLAAGSVIHAVHSNELSDMGGLAKKMPITTWTFVIGALALVGVPGTAGFFSKDLILGSVEGLAAWLPYGALMATAFLTAFYMGRVLLVAFFGAPRQRADHAHESGWWMAGPLVLLAVPSVVVGWLGARFAHLTGGHYELHVGATPIVASALGLLGLSASWMVYGRAKGPSRVAVIALIDRIAKTSAVNRLYEGVYRKGLLGGAGLLGWFDRYVVDGLINWSGWIVLVGGRSLRRVQTGFASDYVFAVTLGAVALAIWGIWP